MANATGWTELYRGDLVSAVFTLFDTALLGWMVAILFFVYQFMLYLKTRNATICFVTGLMFVSLYATSIFVKSASVHIMFLILVFELAGILYALLWK